MSEGATMSTPARARETEVRASNSSVASFTISYSPVDDGGCATAAPSDCGPVERTMPQWPCDVYSHNQTAPTTTNSRISRLIARAACCTIPSSDQAPVAISSFVSGNPNRMAAGTPRECASRASFIASSIEKLNTPGMERTSFRTPSPGQTNRGRSEEHTSELQSHSDLVCRLLLEKKKNKYTTQNIPRQRM